MYYRGVDSYNQLCICNYVNYTLVKRKTGNTNKLRLEYNTPTHTHTDTHHTHTDTQTDTHTHTDTVRQTDRQTDRHRHTQAPGGRVGGSVGPIREENKIFIFLV